MPGTYVRRDRETGEVASTMPPEQAAMRFRAEIRGEFVDPSEPRIYRIDARTIGIEGSDDVYRWEWDLFEGWPSSSPAPSERLVKAATAAGESLMNFLNLPGSASARWFRIVDGTEFVVSPSKGAWSGECATIGCSRKSRWIARVEAAIAPAPEERYRCAKCCDLLEEAAPSRNRDAYLGDAGNFDDWNAWHDRMRALLALTLAELEALRGLSDATA